jgi:hypothetical protein
MKRNQMGNWMLWTLSAGIVTVAAWAANEPMDHMTALGDKLRASHQ